MKNINLIARIIMCISFIIFAIWNISEYNTLDKDQLITIGYMSLLAMFTAFAGYRRGYRDALKKNNPEED